MRKRLRTVLTSSRLRRVLLPTALAAGLLLAGSALAVDTGLDAAAGKVIPHTKDIAEVIGKLIKTALGFVGTLFLLLMVYAGFLYMTARGEPKKIDQAKQMITGAIIGVVIIAGAYAITSFVLTAATGGSTTEETAGPECTPPSTKSDRGGICCTDSDCATNVLTCQNGLCKATEDAFCINDSDCATPLKCAGTVCKP